jgi:tRNA-modifying protein YgfZ
MIPLATADVLALRGRDAAAFAHAQFTSDVQSLQARHWHWSAWLDAQGRVRFFFALLRPDADVLVAWLPLGGASAMREALAPYVFRAAVTLEAAPWMLHAAGAAPAHGAIEERGGGYVLALPGERAGMLVPAFAPAPEAFDAQTLAAWRRADIDARLPLLAPGLGGEFVPQALDLERVDAIRFDKGCYPGQEVAARLHFRGGNKRRLRRLRIAGAAPASGEMLADAAGASAGRILFAADTSERTSIALGVLAESAVELRTIGEGIPVFVES